MTTAGVPTGYFNQTYCVEFDVEDELDGTTLQPPILDSPPTGFSSKDPQNFFRRTTAKLGLIDPDYLVPVDEEGRRGTRGNRFIAFLWIEGPVAGDVGASVEIVDAVEGVSIEQEPIGSLEGLTRFYRKAIFVPQGSVIRVSGMRASGGVPVRVRLHIDFLNNSVATAIALQAAAAQPVVATTLQQFSGFLSVTTPIPGAALTPMPIDSLDFAFDPAIYEHVLGSSDVKVLVAGRYWIWAQGSIDNTAGASRTSSNAQLFVDPGTGFAPVPGTLAFGYHRNAANGEDTLPSFTALDLDADDVIRYAAMRIAGAGPLAFLGDGCRLGIVRMPTL